MDKRRGLRRGHFPIAIFPDAGAEIPLLGPLLDDKRRTALRARLGNRLKRSSEIAVRITAAAIKNPAAPSSLRGAASDKLSFIALRALNPQRDRARVLALRIILAADEIAEASRPADQLPAVVRTLFADGNV